MQHDRINEIKTLISSSRDFCMLPEIRKAVAEIPECGKAVNSFLATLNEIEQGLTEVPQIDVALIGRSRHGKSTLINSLAQEDILKTSAIRPCTATIVKLVYAENWSLEIEFVKKRELLSDWKNAVEDAAEFLKKEDEQSDDPRYLQDTLERFIELFGIDKELPPKQLLQAVKSAEIPTEIREWLGQMAKPTTQNIEVLKRAVSKFLSTEDKYWTVVDRCTIRGPFENWHPQLAIIDLPGTNDLNAHRTQITNSVRNKAKAVAIVTSESNLGTDIDSWLRESRVLADFLEAKASRRQHLFIIRTQLDSFEPKIESPTNSASMTPDEQEEMEEKLYQEAIEEYKEQQTIAYHEMLKDIVSPILGSNSESEDENSKRKELLNRVSNVPVHFVSALAYEVFQGRAEVGRRRKQNLIADFGNDEGLTGVPKLLEFMNQIASDYLEQNFYDDLAAQIESEVALIGHFFRTQNAILEAARNGAGSSVISLTNNVKNEIVPWIRHEISNTVGQLKTSGDYGTEAIRHRLDQNWRLSERRFQDKIDKWNLYAWNSLKSTARKDGVHITASGNYIDIPQDVCSVLVDDLLLVWTSYRDFVIEKQVNKVTEDFAMQLTAKLKETKQGIENPDAEEAINEIIEQLISIAGVQRESLLRKVESKIEELESIRKPAYQFVQNSFKPTFEKIANEGGTGCQNRMRNLLIDGFSSNLSNIRNYINDLVNNSAGGLLDSCVDAMNQFGQKASRRILDTTEEVQLIQTNKDLKEVEDQSRVISAAYKLLPPPKA